MVPYIFRIAACTAFGGFIFGYDTGVISGILTVSLFREVMGITPLNAADLTGFIAAMLQAGGFLGCLFQAWINDSLGRRNSILVMCVVFSFGAVLQTLSFNLTYLLIGRFISGFAVSIMAIAVSMYNTEVAPLEIRGTIVGLQQFMVATGIAAAYWVNFFVNEQHSWDSSTIQFQLPLGLQLVPAAILFIGLYFLPDSPRWLVSKGLIVTARASLAKIRELPTDDPAIDSEMADIVLFFDTHNNSTWTEVFSDQNLDRLMVGVPLFAGQNMINYFSPSLFKQLGLSSRGADLFATGLVGVVKMVMTLPALILVDRLGRRPLMLFGTILMALSFCYIGVYNAFHSGQHSIDAGGYIAIVLVYVFMAGYAISWGIIHYVIPSEIYPTNIRAKANAIGSCADWGFQFISIKMYPFIQTMPNGGVYFISAGLLTLFLIWIFLFLPETRGIPLEDMDRIFCDWSRWRKQLWGKKIEKRVCPNQ